MCVIIMYIKNLGGDKMIKLKLKTIENVVILKLEEGTFEELSKINITGIRGLGGFTIS